jgi:hypothetical protein
VAKDDPVVKFEYTGVSKDMAELATLCCCVSVRNVSEKEERVAAYHTVPGAPSAIRLAKTGTSACTWPLAREIDLTLPDANHIDVPS